MIVTSLNLYDYSENNFEMGIAIDAQYDEVLYNDAKAHAQLIIDTSKLMKQAKQHSNKKWLIGGGIGLLMLVILIVVAYLVMRKRR